MMEVKIDLADAHTVQGDVETLIQTALDYSNPLDCMRRHLSSANRGFTLDSEIIRTEGRVILIAIGKAAQSMAAAFIEISETPVEEGIVITKHLLPIDGAIPPGVQLRIGDHPVPGKKSIESTQELISKISGLSAQDTVVCLISGGGSALVTSPRAGVELAEIQITTRLLLSCGAKIDEINCVRKHLDLIKGGGMLKMAQPGKVVSIILSDVVGSPLDVIASGPTTPDQSTFNEMRAILDKYGLIRDIPTSIQQVIEKGLSGEIPETLKPEAANQFDHRSAVIGSNYQTARALVEKAREIGYQARLLSTFLEGEAREAGAYLATIAREMRSTATSSLTPACFVFGGETTVILRGAGSGGRNLETALGAVADIAGLERIAIVTLATDGEDGTTDTAGAMVTGSTYLRGKERGVIPSDHLNRNDSYHYFVQAGGLIRTGPTGTNVNDLAMILCW